MATIIITLTVTFVVAIVIGACSYRRGYRHGYANCRRKYVSAFHMILSAARKAIKEVKGGTDGK